MSDWVVIVLPDIVVTVLPDIYILNCLYLRCSGAFRIQTRGIIGPWIPRPTSERTGCRSFFCNLSVCKLDCQAEGGRRLEPEPEDAKTAEEAAASEVFGLLSLLLVDIPMVWGVAIGSDFEFDERRVLIRLLEDAVVAIGDLLFRQNLAEETFAVRACSFDRLSVQGSGFSHHIPCDTQR